MLYQTSGSFYVRHQFIYMMKTERGNETCTITHCDIIENLITTRAGLWTKWCPSFNVLIIRNRLTLAIGNNCLLFCIGCNDERIDFSSCFRSAFITLRLRTLRVCHWNGTDMSLIIFASGQIINWYQWTGGTIILITRRISIIISSYSRGISRHRPTFSKNEKLMIIQTNTFEQKRQDSKVHFKRFIIRFDFKIKICLLLNIIYFKSLKIFKYLFLYLLISSLSFNF